MPNPVIPWPGGKRRLIKHLYPHVPAHETYVEAFAGGAAALLMRPVPAPLEVLKTSTTTWSACTAASASTSTSSCASSAGPW